MLRNIFLKLIIVSFVLCYSILNVSASNADENEINTLAQGLQKNLSLVSSSSKEGLDNYNQYNNSKLFTVFFPDSGLGQALKTTYKREPTELTYGDFLRNAQSYYCENHPNLTADPNFKFDVLNTPVACIVFPQVVDNEGSLSLMGMAIPSVSIGSSEYYTTLGLAERFEHLGKSTDGHEEVRFLPIKVSVSAKLFESSERDKLKQAIHRATYKALNDLLSVRPLIAFDETDPEKTLRVELTADTLRTGQLRPVIIYSPLEGNAFRHGVPYAN